MTRWSCCCTPPDRTRWRVSRRHLRCSAFDGYRAQWSPYSDVVCLDCHRRWRSKAAYVATLPDRAEEDR